MNRNRESVFEFTPCEARMLELARAGLSYKEIAAIVGRRSNSVGNTICRAVEKERLQPIIERSKFQNRFPTLPRRAKHQNTAIPGGLAGTQSQLVENSR